MPKKLSNSQRAAVAEKLAYERVVRLAMAKIKRLDFPCARRLLIVIALQSVLDPTRDSRSGLYLVLAKSRELFKRWPELVGPAGLQLIALGCRFKHGAGERSQRRNA